MRIFLLLGLLSILVSLLTSCSITPVGLKQFGNIKITAPVKAKNKNAEWILYQKQHQKLIKGSWVFSGAVGVNMSGKGQSARVVWERYPDKYQIDLFGPFGIGGIKIKYQNNIYEFIDANGDIYKDKFPDKLLEKVAGFGLPLSGSDYWILGVVMPNIKPEYQKLNQYGALEKLSQNGWDITYNNYKVFNGVLMPVNITFYNSLKDLRIKLVIKRWAFNLN